MVLVTNNLYKEFEAITQALKVSNEATRAYIFNIFASYMRSSANDLSTESLTLKYAEAKQEYSFEKFQSLGDWIFFTRSLFPTSLKNASLDYYDAIAQNSYYRCYKILDRKWILFEELADEFPNFVETISVESDLAILL